MSEAADSWIDLPRLANLRPLFAQGKVQLQGMRLEMGFGYSLMYSSWLPCTQTC